MRFFLKLTLMKSNYTAEMTDSPTFSYTSTPEIPTPLYSLYTVKPRNPEARKKNTFRAEPSV